MTVLTRRLGRSNLEVSALGLGCWAIGGAMAAGDQPSATPASTTPKPTARCAASTL